MNSIPQKHCSVCKQPFPITSEFWHKNKSKKDGFSNVCKDCAIMRNRKWTKNNPERIKVTRSQYYQNNRESCDNRHQEWVRHNPDRAKKIKQDCVRRNPERCLKSARDWRSRNRMYERQRAKDYRQRNPEKAKAYRHARRAREIAAEGMFTAEDVALAYRAQRGKCWHCGKHVDHKFHADHLVPLKHGGTNWPNNIVVSCSDCNLRKGGKLCYQWNGKLF